MKRFVDFIFFSISIFASSNLNAQVDHSKVYRIVDEMPVLPSCQTFSSNKERKSCTDTELIKYMKENIHYPDTTGDNNLTYLAIVKFVVNKDGEIKDLRTGKIKPQYTTPEGYKKISLINPDAKKCFLVHRLVAIQFIEPVENKLEVDHIDRDKSNNNVDNCYFHYMYLFGFDDIPKHLSHHQIRLHNFQHKHISYNSSPN